MSEYYSQHVVEIDEVDSCLEEGSTQNIPAQASQKMNYSCDFQQISVQSNMTFSNNQPHADFSAI